MGVVFDIQRCCCDDGPGIRTTVFLKGCQLRCSWCHNPESFRKEPQLRYLRHLCQNCGACVSVCPQGAHAFEEGHHRVDHSKCVGCGACAEICPARALQLVGREMTAREVMDTVLRDRAYYETSGGGLTVSGGEPTFQGKFLLELLTLAKEAGVHTCLETNGYIPKELLEKLLPLVDLFLLDYKLTDREKLKKHTLADGALWEHCLRQLQAYSKPVILRLPIIPGINDTKEHFAGAAAVVKAHSCIQQAQVMAYHSIGEEKWQQLGYEYSLKELPGATAQQKQRWQEMLDAFLRP